MGYSQRAAILTTPKKTYLRISTRCLVFNYNPNNQNNYYYNSDTEKFSCILSYENRYGGMVYNPILFQNQLDEFTNKINKFQTVPTTMIVVQIPFSMSQDEEFFADNIYRLGQKKLFDRLSDKANKAIEKFNEESVLLCTSGIAEYVSLFK